MRWPSLGREPDAGRPAASQRARVEFRSTRCGESGQPSSNSVVSTTSMKFAFAIFSLWPRWLPLCFDATKRVPIQAPHAPRSRAAARPLPSARPPAATTGTSAASTTAGSNAISGASPTRCPPASRPCATTKSTPSFAARGVGWAGHRPEDGGVDFLRLADVRTRVAHNKRNNTTPGVQCAVEPPHLISVQNEIHSKRFRAPRRCNIFRKRAAHIDFRRVRQRHESDCPRLSYCCCEFGSRSAPEWGRDDWMSQFEPSGKFCLQCHNDDLLPRERAVPFRVKTSLVASARCCST